MSKVVALSTSRISQVKNYVNTSDKSFAGGKSFIEKSGRFFRRAAHITKRVALVTFGPGLLAAGMWIANNLGNGCDVTSKPSRSKANANLIGVLTGVTGVVVTAAGAAAVQESDSFEEKEEKRAEKGAEKGAENGTIHIIKAMEMAKTK